MYRWRVSFFIGGHCFDEDFATADDAFFFARAASLKLNSLIMAISHNGGIVRQFNKGAYIPYGILPWSPSEYGVTYDQCQVRL